MWDGPATVYECVCVWHWRSHDCGAVCPQEELSVQTERLQACRDRLSDLQSMFQARLQEKLRIEDSASTARAKVSQATSLIHGLSGERERWLLDFDRFAERKTKLVGDAAVSAAFLSYCGQFQQDARQASLSLPLLQSAALVAFVVICCSVLSCACVAVQGRSCRQHVHSEGSERVAPNVFHAFCRRDGLPRDAR